MLTRALITLDVALSFRNSLYTVVYTVICYSQCATVSVQQSLSVDTDVARHPVMTVRQRIHDVTKQVTLIVVRR